MGVTGKSQWCVITDAKKDCRYTRGRCLKVAQSVGGGCVENTELALALSRFGDGQFEFASFQDQVEFELRSRSGDLGGKEGEQVILKDDD